MSASPWPGRDAELVALAGQSGEQIAIAMGLSLGSINGRLRRLKRNGLRIARPPPVHEGGPRRKARGGISATWPAEAVALLRAEWPGSRLTSGEIADALGKDLQAVRHKATALGLYRPEGTRRGPAPQRVVPPPPPRAPTPKRIPPLALDRPLASAPRAPVYRPPPPRPHGPIVECCWPIGEPGTRDFRYCDEPSERGRPYCADHVRVSYVKERHHADPLAGTGALFVAVS